MSTTNEITHVMTDFCTGEILPVISLSYIMCNYILHVKYLSITFVNSHTCGVLSVIK